MEPRNRFRGTDPPAYVAWRAGCHSLLVFLNNLWRLGTKQEQGYCTGLPGYIGSLESIPWLHNMKNEDEDDFFWIEAKKNEYIRTSTIERKKKNEFIRS